MALFKCKMCGGDLEVAPEASVAQCEYCGTQQTLPCDLLLIAAGFVGCETATAERFDVALSQRGTMMPADGSHRLRGNLFSAGDMRTGQSLVVRALADGRAAALEVHEYLKGKAR